MKPGNELWVFPRAVLMSGPGLSTCKEGTDSPLTELTPQVDDGKWPGRPPIGASPTLAAAPSARADGADSIDRPADPDVEADRLAIEAWENEGDPN